MKSTSIFRVKLAVFLEQICSQMLEHVYIDLNKVFTC
jgi:hypothetical protein